MQVHKQIDVNASAQSAWDILQDLGTVDKWISSVHHSQASGNAQGETRICQTELGPFEETIITFDEKKLLLSYSAKGEKMPFFVKHLQNNWKIQPLSAESCRVLMRMDCTIMFPFTIFPGPIMKMKFNSILNDAIHEFKHYVETGKPAKTKLKALEKAQKKAA
jgi:ribosome-associated toxin RatA of RatAB toxin-antitoxin module